MQRAGTVRRAVVAVSGVWLMGCGLSAAVAQRAPQGASSGNPTGTVTGRVLASDNQLPARFAQVMLQSVASVNPDAGNGSPAGSTVQTRTDVDGSFTASNLAPGDYYVTANAPGFVSERALLQAAVNAGADPVDLLARIPVAHVAPDGTSSVIVMMERGAVISGRLVWEDGSPASGVAVSAVTTSGSQNLPDALQGIQSGGSAMYATTDDRGAFRITGLPSGEYLLRAILQARFQFGGGSRSQQYGSPIRVYAPGVFHRADAKPVTVHEGEERPDVRMVIDLRGLHTVSGHVASIAAGQNIVSGTVQMADSTDRELQLSGSVAANGDFAVQYVPPGNYTLQVSGASTQAGGSRGRSREADAGPTFQPYSQTVVVNDGDVTGENIELSPTQTN